MAPLLKSIDNRQCRIIDASSIRLSLIMPSFAYIHIQHIRGMCLDLYESYIHILDVFPTSNNFMWMPVTHHPLEFCVCFMPRSTSGWRMLGGGSYLAGLPRHWACEARNLSKTHQVNN
jgi:hypothetical protein